MTDINTTVIEPNRSWFRLELKEIWDHRDLVQILVRRNFVAQFKQTVLGPLWFVLQPLINTIVFTVIFGKLADVPTDGLPMMLYYMCGQLGWAYFARCWGANSSILLANKGLFEKVYFPRLTIPVSTCISIVFGLLIQFLLFAGFWIYYKYFSGSVVSFGITGYVWLIPFALIQSGILGLGIGLWISSLSAKYRDVARLGGMMTSLWMYGTPIIWSLSLFAEKVPAKWHWVPMLNPMSWVIECFRLAFLGKGIVTLPYILSSLVITAFIFISGVMIFNRTERTFIDTA